MKKILLLVTLMLTTIFTSSVVVANAETLEAPIEEVVEIQETEEVIEDYTQKVTNWIISGVLGLLGTLGVATLFRKQLKELIAKVLTLLGVVGDNKDKAKEELDKIINTAKSVLASVEKAGNKIIEDTKEEMNALRNDFNLLCTAMSYLVCGMQELVSNGTSEDVCNMLKDFNKEVENNASKEI
jgi:hypothetical protein